MSEHAANKATRNYVKWTPAEAEALVSLMIKDNGALYKKYQAPKSAKSTKEKIAESIGELLVEKFQGRGLFENKTKKHFVNQIASLVKGYKEAVDLTKDTGGGAKEGEPNDIMRK